MKPTTADRLRHIRDAAEDARTFVQGRDRGDLDQDRMLSFALTRAIEIIGEAAAALPEEFKGAYPDAPWRQIVGMRNRLIHGYYDVDLDILWDTVTVHLAPLLDLVNAALAADSEP